MCFFILLFELGPDTPLYHQTLATFHLALASGTMKNRSKQALTYIKFMIAYNFDWMNPTLTQLAMFTQFLGNSFASPASVKNYFSGAKNWLYLHRGSTRFFQGQELAMMSKALAEKSIHVPAPASPLTPQDIKIICQYIDANQPHHPAIKASILMAFATFMRVSNILSPNKSSNNLTHTLLAKDVQFDGQCIWITIRSTKTRRTGKPHILQVLPTVSVDTCPVRTWLYYKSNIQPCPLGPAFMIDGSTPLTPPPVVDVMRRALTLAGRTFPTKVSFHSLRRGGAQTAAYRGASEQELMNHGTWSSKEGLSAYLKPLPSMVPTILAGTLA